MILGSAVQLVDSKLPENIALSDMALLHCAFLHKQSASTSEVMCLKTREVVD